MRMEDAVIFDEEEYLIFQDYRGNTKKETDRNLRAALIQAEEDPEICRIIQKVQDQLEKMTEKEFQDNRFLHFLEFDVLDLEVPEETEAIT